MQNTGKKWLKTCGTSKEKRKLKLRTYHLIKVGLLLLLNLQTLTEDSKWSVRLIKKFLYKSHLKIMKLVKIEWFLRSTRFKWLDISEKLGNIKYLQFSFWFRQSTNLRTHLMGVFISYMQNHILILSLGKEFQIITHIVQTKVWLPLAISLISLLKNTSWLQIFKVRGCYWLTQQFNVKNESYSMNRQT